MTPGLLFVAIVPIVANRRAGGQLPRGGGLHQIKRILVPVYTGALLRREGIYSSQLSKWRKRMKGGALAALAPKRRGPEAKGVDARDREIADLQRQLSRATRRAERFDALVEIQKKFRCFWIALPPSEEPNS